MAESKCTTSAPSSASTISLGRALSHSRLNQLDQSDVFQSQTSLSRGTMGQGRRRRKSSTPSIESLDISPTSEARVLVINTGGTIGMTYHNNGKHMTACRIICNR